MGYLINSKGRDIAYVTNLPACVAVSILFKDELLVIRDVITGLRCRMKDGYTTNGLWY